MNRLLQTLLLSAGLATSLAVLAQAPATAPAGSTGLCKDGSYTSNATKRGSCSRHGGVKDWYAADTAASTPTKPAAPAAPTAAAPAPAPAPAATPAPAPAPAPAAAAKAGTKAAKAPAPGGGPGQVWVNTSTKVYHCSGTRYYGTTKQGEYMTEAAAKAAGARPDHGKACGT